MAMGVGGAGGGGGPGGDDDPEKIAKILEAAAKRGRVEDGGGAEPSWKREKRETAALLKAMSTGPGDNDEVLMTAIANAIYMMEGRRGLPMPRAPAWPTRPGSSRPSLPVMRPPPGRLDVRPRPTAARVRPTPELPAPVAVPELDAYELGRRAAQREHAAAHGQMTAAETDAEWQTWTDAEWAAWRRGEWDAEEAATHAVAEAEATAELVDAEEAAAGADVVMHANPLFALLGPDPEVRPLPAELVDALVNALEDAADAAAASATAAAAIDLTVEPAAAAAAADQVLPKVLPE